MDNNDFYINKNKYLYYYLLFFHYILIVFFILGMIIIYKNKNISLSLPIILVIVFIFTVFIQNNGIINCCYNKTIKEGWKDVHCFRLYSQYSINQYNIDKIDKKYNDLLTTMVIELKDQFSKYSSQYVDLETEITTLLNNFASNLANVVQTDNAWNSQYATTLHSMNNMVSSLYGIQNNLDASQYTSSYKLV